MRLERWLRGEKAPVAGETRYSLKIENQPVGGVIQALARRLNYELEVDDQLPQDRLHKLVSFRVENATPDELVSRALQDTGIRAVREGNKLRLVPAP
jgi:type II secretory pathway component GspD/PulD (secretin)